MVEGEAGRRRAERWRRYSGDPDTLVFVENFVNWRIFEQECDVFIEAAAHSDKPAETYAYILVTTQSESGIRCTCGKSGRRCGFIIFWHCFQMKTVWNGHSRLRGGNTEAGNWRSCPQSLNVQRWPCLFETYIQVNMQHIKQQSRGKTDVPLVGLKAGWDKWVIHWWFKAKRKCHFGVLTDELICDRIAYAINNDDNESNVLPAPMYTRSAWRRTPFSPGTICPLA